MLASNSSGRSVRQAFDERHWRGSLVVVMLSKSFKALRDLFCYPKASAAVLMQAHSGIHSESVRTMVTPLLYLSAPPSLEMRVSGILCRAVQRQQ